MGWIAYELACDWLTINSGACKRAATAAVDFPFSTSLVPNLSFLSSCFLSLEPSNRHSRVSPKSWFLSLTFHILCSPSRGLTFFGGSYHLFALCLCLFARHSLTSLSDRLKKKKGIPYRRFSSPAPPLSSHNTTVHLNYAPTGILGTYHL